MIRRFAQLVLMVALVATAARAQLIRDEVPEVAKGAEVVERLGEAVPGDIELTNAEGERVTMGAYLSNGKPTILAMVYYRCPMICTVTLSQLQDTVNDLDYSVGEDFNLVVVSFDHTEPVSAAAQYKYAALADYNRELSPTIRAGFAFHVTDEANTHRLGDAVGFHFRRLDNGEYAHPVALMILTPDGHISRYVYGLEYPAKRIKLALLDATKGEIAESIGDYFLHLCFSYDPDAGAYNVQAMTTVRIGGILTMVALGTLIIALKLTEKRRHKKHRDADQPAPGTGHAS